MNGKDPYEEEDWGWDEWAEEAFEEMKDAFPSHTGGGNNLPAKLPATQGSTSKSSKLPKINKKIGLPVDWDFTKQSEERKLKEELRKLKQEKVKTRKEASKKITWKIISKNSEYEVLVGGESLGRVRDDIKGKWNILPSFEWEDTYAKRTMVNSAYQSFHDSGHALVNLWVIS